MEGAWDEAADTAALKEAAFEAQVAEEQPSPELFESMYRETASGEAIDGLRAQNMVTDASTGEHVLDETAYYRDLQAALIEAQPIDMAAVQALGEARAEAVRAYMVDTAGVDSGRVRVVEAVAVEPGDADWVRCRLDVDTL